MRSDLSHKISRGIPGKWDAIAPLAGSLAGHGVVLALVVLAARQPVSHQPISLAPPAGTIAIAVETAPAPPAPASPPAPSPQSPPKPAELAPAAAIPPPPKLPAAPAAAPSPPARDAAGALPRPSRPQPSQPQPSRPRPVTEATARTALPTAPGPPAPAAAASPGATAAPVPQAPFSPDWTRALEAWLTTHKVYPQEARRRGEEGTAQVRFTVERSGQVSTVALLHGTGFADLDDAVQRMLRDARVPGFPASMTQSEAAVTVRIRYVLEPP